MKLRKRTVRIFGVDVDYKLATEAMKLGGYKSRTAAVRAAIDEYLASHRMRMRSRN